MKKKLTILIVTFKTNKKILYRCLSSIKKDIKIIIVENSKKFENEDFFKRKFKNIKIFCTGLNLGYGGGNNYGLKKIKTKYALILSPDVFCSKNFFKNLKNHLNNPRNFHLIGCNDSKNSKMGSAGFFNNKNNYRNNEKKYLDKYNKLIRVDWIKGFSVIINLKKFKNRDIFDQNFFLFMEEIDLCMSIHNKKGNVYFARDLLVKHLGFRSSFGLSKLEKQKSSNIKNWHYMWSSFYFYKKNYSFYFALKKMSGKLIRSFIKTIFYFLTLNKIKRDKYKFRFLGILHSILGLSSNFRS